MTLADMIASDRDAFTCDMAETYHIYEPRALPVSTLAVLASGLRADSRSKMALYGFEDIPKLAIMTHIADTLSMIYYALTATGKGKDKKPSLLRDLLTGQWEKKKENVGFNSGEEFHVAWKRLTGEKNG